MMKQKGNSEVSVCLFVSNDICIQFHICSHQKINILFKNVLMENLKVVLFMIRFFPGKAV